MNASTRTFASLALATLAIAPFAHAAVETFDDPITLAASQTAGTWYTDRYAPAGFESGVFFDGDYRLKHSIGAADGASSRPGSYSSAFYNTQGRKYDLPTSTTYMKIDLYVDASWETSGRRMAGLWGTGVDGFDTISAYPIVEFISDGTTGEFRAYNTTDGTWFSMGLPTGFAYDAWTTLEMSIVGSNWVAKVGDLTMSQDANGTVAFDNVILQGHNTTDGVNYDIYWDNFDTVPAPGALALLGLAGMAKSRRRSA